jgi:two-component system chemotaxis sensor kinase CheA
MKARLQPIGHLWAKLPRIVRDLAAACGRQVRLEVAGGDTELDRALLEAVKDPLTHLVRNAVDHGIEDVQTREAAGKPAEGVLTVRAYHAGGQVVVEVEDDGQGIDPGRVAQAAVAQGLRTPAQIASMGAADVLQLLFLPGFSMAEVVTNVSGRGVGLDVVHTRIGAIGGTTEVESTIGRGTTWRLRIPLTLAIISAVIVESAGERYAIPAGNVLELVAPDGESAVATIEYAGLTPVLRLREALLPLVGLRDVLGLSGAPGTGSEGEPGTANLVAVVRAGTRRFGLGVDGVLDTEDIVVKPLAHRLRAVGVYAGVTLLGDGRVSLILDVQGIAGRWLTGQSVEAAEEPRALPSQPAAVTRHVLVVGIGDQRRVAIPLASLTRVERVRGDAVEHVGEREVIQYREAIVPLVRLDRLLGVQADPTGPEPEQQNLFVVIFTHGARTVAVAVRDVLDIVEDDAERHSQVDDHGSTVLGEHVTELLDVRQAVLSGDPAFFGDEDGALSSAPGAAGASFGSVGGVG